MASADNFVNEELDLLRFVEPIPLKGNELGFLFELKIFAELRPVKKKLTSGYGFQVH